VKVGGERTREERKEDSVELRSVFQHTEASLFNVLRSQLMLKNKIFCLAADRSSEAETRKPDIGDLVEMTGDIVGNPL
jgi:hypothetical protein